LERMHLEIHCQFMISSPRNSNRIQNNIQQADGFYSSWIRVPGF
jgi:hypothetical protein